MTNSPPAKTLSALLNEGEQDELTRKAKFSARESYQLKFNLIKLRKEKGLTAADMAERTGFSIKKITKFEKYYNHPKLSMLNLYALALEVSIAYTIVYDLPPEDK
jgi:DNA-binding XRE family transcriptional regulator